MWLRNAEVAGQLFDIAVDAGRITRIVPAGGLHPEAGSTVVDANGGWLLPGLHDHHLHLFSLAASVASVDCSPAAAPTLERLAASLRAHRHPDGWVRGVGHHDAATGPLDRHVLDRLVPDRPVRIQHRGGALWVLNSLALDRVAHLLDDTADVERDDRGMPNGRLWRYDSRLSPALPRREPDLAAVGRELRSLGITGVTDATPELAVESAELLASAVTDGRLPVDVTVLGAGARVPAPLLVGPAKIMLRDHDLPTLDQLVQTIADHRSEDRAVAIHCVTLEALVLTLAAIEEVGAHPGDRLEHAAVLPRALLAEVCRLGLRAVVQPDFIRTRGAEYLREMRAEELTDLCPCRRLHETGIRTACSSDAPFGTLDPWQVIATATHRRTRDGRVINADEAIDAATALSGYLSAANDPGGQPRRITIGAPADLVLLRAGRAEALTDPERELVRATLRGNDLRLVD